MKKAFLVVSPENSGNHILEHILTEMGCFGGRKMVKDTEGYPVRIKGKNKKSKNIQERNIIRRFLINKIRGLEFATNVPLLYMRSLPNRKQHHEDLHPVKIKKRFAEIGYDMTTIIPVRDQIATILGNYREDSIDKRIAVLMDAWAYLGEMLKDLKPFYFINVSLLFKDIDVLIKEIEFFTGLRLQGDLKIWDADMERHRFFMKKGLILPPKEKNIEYSNILYR